MCAMLCLWALPAAAERVTITISAAGDCTLGGDINNGGESRFRKRLKDEGNDYGYFLRLVKPIFDEDDLTVVNLEGLLTTTKKYRKGRDFNFRGDPEYARILSEGGVDVVNLANNHMRDFLDRGIADTVAALEAEGVGVFYYENVWIREVKGVNVGFAGFYNVDLKEILKTIEPLREQCDVMVVSFHWGKEGSNKPTRGQVNLAHAVIDAGADLIIGHHPHVIQGIEEYKGRTIAYSLANFCFGGNGNPRDKDTFILRSSFTLEDGVIVATGTEVIPCSVSSIKDSNNFQPRPLEGDAADRIMKRLYDYSKMFDISGVPARGW